MVIARANIHFVGRIPYDDVLRFTATSDCIVALYDPKIPIIGMQA